MHTPEPWLVTRQSGDGLDEFTGLVGVAGPPKTNSRGVEVNTYVAQYCLPEDARLIAASPRLLAVIQGALRIESLWRPFLSEPIGPQHEEECRALELMHSQFVEAVKLATDPT